MGWEEKTEQIIVQIRQWLNNIESKAENYMWLDLVFILVRIRDFIAAVFIIAFVIRHVLVFVYFLLPYLIEFIEFIETLASTFSYYKKEFFLWIFLLLSYMVFRIKSIYQSCYS